MFKHPFVNKTFWSVERSVSALVLLLTVLPVLCFYGDFELYPFAPYNMYSKPFTLPYEDFILEVVTKDATPWRVRSLNNLNESFLEKIIFSLKDDPVEVTRKLNSLYKNCKIAHCVILTNAHAIPFSDVLVIRSLKRVFKTMTALARQQPEDTHIIGVVHIE